MENLKIRVNSEAESKEAQELFFKLGGSWAGYKEIQDWPEIKQLYLGENYITFSNDINFFVKDHKEITLPELRAMVSPMKEYLNANCNYEFVLSNKKYDGFIEIPDGAIRARFYPRVPDGLEFENSTLQWWHDENNEWISYDNYSSTLEHSRVVWQREQDEPFLTPETTLNDQYAEIEQVRQHKKHERNSSAWGVQVGGDHYKQFQIQPMQFALENKLDAAQQNVIKYIMRHSFKNGKQDLEKAKHYIDLMIEFYYGENNNG